VPLPKIPAIKQDVVIVERVPLSLPPRPAVATSLGCEIKNIALPHPDPGHPATMLAGVKKRFAMQPPSPKKQLLRRFRRFVKKWVHNNMVPLAPDSDVSVQTWLDATNYPAWRKAQLLRKWEAVTNPHDRRYTVVKSFMKDETYVEYKHARAINSRVDEFKCATGPIFKLIEKELFKHEWFIKKVPVCDRPAYIMRLLGHGAKFFVTDHTAFEAHFTRELMDSCEFILYEYMVQKLPTGGDFMQFVHDAIGGRNRCVFKHFDVYIDATRMSGEMNTSLGNGFSNLMFMLFMAHEKGCENVFGVVEGDDGLFTMSGELPTVEDFANLGLTLKLELADEINVASFCGLVFDPDDLVNVTDPITAMADFGWTSGRYARCSSRRKMELLRCAAMSMAYQYSGCPILSSLAAYGLRVTSGYRAKPGLMDGWWRDHWNEMCQNLSSRGALKSPQKNTRFLVEKLYGITCEEQIKIESYLDSLDTLQPLDHHVIDYHVPRVWKHYSYHYVRPIDCRFDYEVGSIATAV